MYKVYYNIAFNRKKMEIISLTIGKQVTVCLPPVRYLICCHQNYDYKDNTRGKHLYY